MFQNHSKSTFVSGALFVLRIAWCWTKRTVCQAAATSAIPLSCYVILIFCCSSFTSFRYAVCASLQPVRRHEGSVQMVEGHLGRGGVTKLGSGPSGFQGLLSGDTCVVTGRPHGAALWAYQGVACCRLWGLPGPALCGYACATLREVDGRSTLKADKGISMC